MRNAKNKKKRLSLKMKRVKHKNQNEIEKRNEIKMSSKAHTYYDNPINFDQKSIFSFFGFLLFCF